MFFLKKNIYHGYKYLHNICPLTVFLDFFFEKYFVKTTSDKLILLDGRRCLLENEGSKGRGVIKYFLK